MEHVGLAMMAAGGLIAFLMIVAVAALPHRGGDAGMAAAVMGLFAALGFFFRGSGLVHLGRLQGSPRSHSP